MNSPQYAAAIQRAYAPAFGARTRIIVIAGETIEIECVVEGSPLPKIHWYKNEKTITLDNIKYVARADKLLITNATKKDDGSYRCMAENLAGKNMDSVQVTVGGI